MPDLAPAFSGTCPICGRTEVPMTGRLLDEHPEQRIKGFQPDGNPKRHNSEDDCAGSLGPAEEGTVTRPDPKPRSTR